MKKNILLFFIVILFFISCFSVFSDNSKVKPELLKFLKSEELEALVGKIKSKEETGIVIVDVRPESVYKTSHIPTAVNIPNGITDSKFEELKNKDLILYCETGGRVEFAKKNLIKDGFKIEKLLNFGGFGRYNGKKE